MESLVALRLASATGSSSMSPSVPTAGVIVGLRRCGGVLRAGGPGPGSSPLTGGGAGGLHDGGPGGPGGDHVGLGGGPPAVGDLVEVAGELVEAGRAQGPADGGVGE